MLDITTAKKVLGGRQQIRRKLTKDQTWEYLQNAGVLTDEPWALGDYSKVIGIWKNKDCYVIGGGPTLKDFLDIHGWHFFDNKNTIGINHIIEDYDLFKIFLSLDKRFFDLTTYDISKFNGLMVLQNKTLFRPDEKTVIFKTRYDGVSEDIGEGLYSGNLSGLAAVHLAIITGAEKIFLVGFGMGKSTSENYHHKKNYTGAEQTENKFRKYKRTRNYYDNFSFWRRKIFNISSFDEYRPFKTVSPAGFESEKIKVIDRGPEIIHLSFSGEMAHHSDITRGMITQCDGKHKLVSFDSFRGEDADLYITNHFISTNKQVLNWPYKNKTINIVHTMNCWPDNAFKKNIALSYTWKEKLIQHGISADNISVIPSGTWVDEYKNESLALDKKVFGRITRWSSGKIPEWWNDFVCRILAAVPDAWCKMFVHPLGSGPEMICREKIIYRQGVHQFEYKGQYLRDLSVYVHANGFFKEISPHAIIEAMATGLPIIYLYEDSVAEMIGSAGIACHNEMELQKELIEMLNDYDKRKEYSEKSKKRARMYNIENTIKLMNEVVAKCLTK